MSLNASCFNARNERTNTGEKSFDNNQNLQGFSDVEELNIRFFRLCSNLLNIINVMFCMIRLPSFHATVPRPNMMNRPLSLQVFTQRRVTLNLMKMNVIKLETISVGLLNFRELI